MKTIQPSNNFPFANKHNIIVPEANNREHVIKVNYLPKEWDSYLSNDVELIEDQLIKPNPFNLAHLVILNVDPAEWGKCSALPGHMFTTEAEASNPVTGILTYTMLRRAMGMLFLAVYDEEELIICPGALNGSYDLSEVEHKGMVTFYIDMTDEWWSETTCIINNTKPPMIKNPTRLDMLYFANSVYAVEEECIFDFDVTVMKTYANQMVARFKYWIA